MTATDPITDLLNSAEALVLMLEKKDRPAKLRDLGTFAAPTDQSRKRDPYTIAHEWIRQRCYEPKAPAAFRIQAWVQREIASMGPSLLTKYHKTLRAVAKAHREKAKSKLVEAQSVAALADLAANSPATEA